MVEVGVLAPRREDARLERAAAELAGLFEAHGGPMTEAELARLLGPEATVGTAVRFAPDACGEGFALDSTCFYYQPLQQGFMVYRASGFDEADCFTWPERRWHRGSCPTS